MIVLITISTDALLSLKNNLSDVDGIQLKHNTLPVHTRSVFLAPFLRWIRVDDVRWAVFTMTTLWVVSVPPSGSVSDKTMLCAFLWMLRRGFESLV